MGKVKDTSYFVVQGWMLNQLHLKGNTLQVFAIIHGFSHSEDNEYKGSLQYLCEFTGASRSTVIRSLTELQKRGYIDKREAYENGVKFNRYKSRDNIAAGRKFVQDALVRCKVLQNDGWKGIAGFSDDLAVDKARPRVEIEIIEMDD